VALALVGASCGGAQIARDEEAGHDDRIGVVAASRGSDGEPALSGRDPDRDEVAALREAMRIAERLRSLRFTRPVPVRVQSRDDITAFVRSRIEDDELEQARLFYTAIGLLPADVDLRALVLSVMGEQIAGFYDPRRHTMVVRDDVMEEMTRLVARGGTILGTPSSMVLVHEYVHALQDQRLALDEDEDDSRTIDEENAYAALVEGDATLTMLGIGLAGSGRTLGDLTRTRGLLRAQLSDDVEAGPEGSELAGAPAILRAPLLSRYLDGLVFVGTLHGGHDDPHRAGFAAIDAAFAAPPTSTEQILHPARYASRDRPAPIALPTLASFEATGYAAVDEDTLGELELSVFFAQGSGHDRDRDAAAGWDGDRLRVYRRTATVGAGPPLAFLWLSRWDDEREAADAEAAARRVGVALTTPTGPVVVQRIGRALSISAGLPELTRDETDAALASLARAPTE
jgi:hypothetical protein